MPQFWVDLLFSPTVIIAALVIGTLGEVTKRAILGSNTERDKTSDGVAAHTYRTSAAPGAPAAVPMWRRIYYVTLPAHPVVMGALIGLIPWLPPADGLAKEGYEMAARLGTYTFAGVVCKIGYDTIISTVRRALQSRSGGGGGTGGGSSSTPTDQPSDASSDAGGAAGG